MAASAKEAGYTGLAPFSLFWTLMVMTWIYLNLSFMSSSAYIGSEVKNARKLQLWSMPATLFIVGIGVLISVWVIDHAVGYNFLAVLGWADPTGLGLGLGPDVHRAGRRSSATTSGSRSSSSSASSSGATRGCPGRS